MAVQATALSPDRLTVEISTPVAPVRPTLINRQSLAEAAPAIIETAITAQVKSFITAPI